MKIKYFMFLFGLILGYRVIYKQIEKYYVVGCEDDFYWYKNCGWN